MTREERIAAAAELLTPLLRRRPGESGDPRAPEGWREWSRISRELAEELKRRHDNGNG